MKAVKRYFKENIGILAALLVMIAFLCIYPRTSTTFPTKTNIFNVLRQSAPNVILSCGMTFAILLGGIDLSVGAIIAMSGCLGAGAVVWGGMPEIVGILIGILSGGVFGLFNGFMISSELPEIINMSDRVYTMYEGNLTGCISYEEGLTQEAIMKLATLETAGGNNE
jgi:ribose transport system permease protein